MAADPPDEADGPPAGEGAKPSPTRPSRDGAASGAPGTRSSGTAGRQPASGSRAADTPADGTAKATRGLMRTGARTAAPDQPAPRRAANQDTSAPPREAQRAATPAPRAKAPARQVERPAAAVERAGETKGAGLPVPAGQAGAAAAAGAAQLPVPVDAPAAQAGAAQVPAKTAEPAKSAPASKKKRAAPPPRQRVSRTAPLSIAAIHAAMAGHKEGHDPVRLAMKVVVRLASLVWLAGAVVVWMRLIGYDSDLISPSWHAPDGPWISTSVAAAVMPVISVGLWLAGSWGIALWFCALLAATVSFALEPASVPFGAVALTLNIITLAAVVGLGVLQSWRNRDEYT